MEAAKIGCRYRRVGVRETLCGCMIRHDSSSRHMAVLAVLLVVVPCAQSAGSVCGPAFAGSAPRQIMFRSCAKHVVGTASSRVLHPAASTFGARCVHRLAMLENGGAGERLRKLAESLQAGEGATGVPANHVLHQALSDVTIADFGAAAAGWPRCYRSTRIVVKVCDPSCSHS